MNQVRQREVHEHRAEQAQESKAHAKAFVLLLQKFVTDKENRQEDDKNKRCERATALEIAYHERAEKASEAELDRPAETLTPFGTPFAVQKMMLDDDGVLRDSRRFVTHVLREPFGGGARLAGGFFSLFGSLLGCFLSLVRDDLRLFRDKPVRHGTKRRSLRRSRRLLRSGLRGHGSRRRLGSS